jgi:hypothetical protein
MKPAVPPMKDGRPRDYGLDGEMWTKAGHIPPITLILEEDIGVRALPEYKAGWYFCDEAEQINGPFNTFEEAVEGFKKYGENL